MERIFKGIGFTSLMLLVSMPCLWAQSYGGIVQYPTGTNPSDVFVGLFNSDNRPDIAVTNSGSNTISVFLNMQNSAYYQKVDYAVGASPSGIYGGDLDCDGDIDLVASNYGSNTISVLFNNGNGTFSLAGTYPTGMGPSAVFVIDLDPDYENGLDIIVANKLSGTITVFFNNGCGSFSPFSIGTGVNSRPCALFAADFTGYGFEPVTVAVLDATNNKVIIMENNGVGLLWLDYTVSISRYSNSIHGADLDDDVDIDLVVSHLGSTFIPDELFAYSLGLGPGTIPAPYVTILCNAGDHYFPNPTVLSGSGGGNDVYLKDISGDSLPDLVTVYNNIIYTSINTGSCTFAPAIIQYTAATGSVFSSIVAEDINADGDVDLVAANRTNNNIVVLRNKQICCHGTRGNVDWSADDFVDLSDLSRLVCYLDGGGCVLECPEEADIYPDTSPDGIINLGDLSSLVSYLTGGGYILPLCGL